MKLSPGERITLYMLANLYEEAGLSDPDPKLIKEAISRDCEWAISFNTIFEAGQELPDEVKEVSSIMQMWMVLERSFNALSDEEEDRVKAAAIAFRHRVEFEGFDEHTEMRQLNVATFFIDYLDRFRNFENRTLSAMHPKLDEYRKMLPTFERLSKANHYSDLSADQIIEVGNAAL